MEAGIPINLDDNCRSNIEVGFQVLDSRVRLEDVSSNSGRVILGGDGNRQLEVLDSRSSWTAITQKVGGERWGMETYLPIEERVGRKEGGSKEKRLVGVGLRPSPNMSIFGGSFFSLGQTQGKREVVVDSKWADSLSRTRVSSIEEGG
jgi:hypothetical protein